MPLLQSLSVSVSTPNHAACNIPGEAWEALRSCTQLSHLALHHGWLASATRGTFHLSPGIASLTSLRHVVIDGSVDSFGDLWSHSTLTSLILEDCLVAHIVMPPAAAVSMPQLQKLTMLDLRGGLPSMPPQFTCLSAVTSLELTFGEADGPLCDYFWQLPGLVSLKLNCCCFQQDVVLPTGILQLTRLRALNLSNASFTELPDGPYLGGLSALLLPPRYLTRLPPVLHRAKQLEVLDLGDGSMQLELGDLAVLLQMPALRLLCVPARDPSNMRLAMLFRTWKPRLICDNELRVPHMNLLFPRGWDGGMDAYVYAGCLEDDCKSSYDARTTVMRALGRHA